MAAIPFLLFVSAKVQTAVTAVTRVTAVTPVTAYLGLGEPCPQANPLARLFAFLVAGHATWAACLEQSRKNGNATYERH